MRLPQLHTNLNIVVVGQKHRESVDSHAPSPRRRQAVLQGRAEVLIDQLRLIIPRSLVLRLLLEPLPLHSGIVQFRVSIAHLLLHDEQLEAFR